jgi:hypothetical protein
MADYIAYHNPDTMQYPGSQVDELKVLTKHPGKCSTGDRVWLVVGEGKPRKYFLRLFFIVSSIEPAQEERFSTVIRGGDGQFFDPPMPVLHSEGWFVELKAKMLNFRGGFQPIKTPEAIRGLEKAAGIAASASSG